MAYSHSLLRGVDVVGTAQTLEHKQLFTRGPQRASRSRRRPPRAMCITATRTSTKTRGHLHGEIEADRA